MSCSVVVVLHCCVSLLGTAGQVIWLDCEITRGKPSAMAVPVCGDDTRPRRDPQIRRIGAGGTGPPRFDQLL